MQTKIVEKLSDIRTILDASTNIIVILNYHRQIVFCSRSLLEWLNLNDSDKVIGLRPGEVFNCINAFRMPGGCGTSEACCVCAAPKAIIKSQQGEKATVECRIMVNDNDQIDSLDLHIATTPLHINNEKFVIMDIKDISSQKRRRALEHIFFHDIMNTATVILALSHFLAEKPAETNMDLLMYNQSMIKQLVEEIEEQRDLLKAENNELRVDMHLVHSLDLLSEVVNRYTNDQHYENINIQIDQLAKDIEFISNSKLLRRVLVNMLKNALEATKVNETVRVGCNLQREFVEFWVNNPEIMPREIQLQVFQRSFSTKNINRGLGTYSMKLLTERYLNGTISFSVSEKDGTIFYARFPL
jgi:signal transduction histidine kinase